MDTLMRICIFLAIIFEVSSFPGGGPYKSCANLYPKHKVNAKTTVAPYKIEVTPLTYSPGDELTVALSGIDGATFKGFMARANRLRGDTEELVGQFTTIPDGAQGKFWYPSQSNDKNCITHSNAEIKNQVIFKWKAPNVSAGDVQIFATFVQDFKNFWVLQPSKVIKANQAQESTEFSSAVSKHFKDIELEGQCGFSKGCMLYPSFCSGPDCSMAITYRSHEKGIDFEAMATSVGYLTFAISEDGLMGNDETITCMVKDDFVSVQHGFNPAYYNDRHSIVGITNIETKREDGKLYCRWTMPYVNNITHIIEKYPDPIKIQVHTFDLRRKWRLFLAWGDLYAGADVLGKHEELPLVSRGLVNLLEKTLVRANGLYLPMKVHGALMLIGYMAFISVAVVISRNYKHCFDKNFLGPKMWFQLHRALTIGAVIVITTGFILIFVELKAWSQKNNLHAILGTVTTSLVVLQMLLGLLRPSPQSAVRPAFKWAHRVTGKLTQLLSGATVVLALFTTYINHQLHIWLATAIGVWIAVQFFWEIVVYEVYKCTHVPGPPTGDSINMKELASLQKETPDEVNRQNRNFLNIQFAMYCMFIFGITLTSITFLFMF